MRVSTSTLFRQSTHALLDQQAGLAKTQQQLSTGRRILAPADDPVGSARVIELDQGKAVLDRHAANQIAARNAVSELEGALGDAGDVLKDIKDRVLQAGNGTFSDAERAAIAEDVSNKLEQLLAIGNRRDANGQYLFSGYQSGIQPFSYAASTVSYLGDDGTRAIEVAAQRQLQVTESGARVFQSVPSGNGVFSVAAGSTNVGTGVNSPGTVYDSQLLTGHAYRITFTGTGNTFDVLDTTTGTPVSSGNAYVPGAAIRFAGLEMSVSGQPRAADQFDLASSRGESMFDTIVAAANAIAAPRLSATDKTRAQNQLNTAIGSLDAALDHLLVVRSAAGARLNELDTLASVNETQSNELARQRAQLADLDYARAISEFSQQQLQLEAAQKSYLRLSQLSLFNEL